jgi:tetratricopeptide (TPR) repeat protein
VTYESLPFATRAQWHEQLARYLEAIGAPLETIALHYGRSRNQAKTLEFTARAGDAAFRVYATTEAIAQYSLAIGAAKRLGAAPGAAALVATLLQHLYSDRGRALELNGRYGEALANYDEMEAQARERGDRAMELASLLARATLRSTPTSVSDSALGKALSEQALALAHELGDRHAEAKILQNLMLLDNFSGLLREAVQHGEASLALARELGLRDQVAFTLNDLFRPYASIGEYERARAATDEARQYWIETGDQSGLADNLSRSARIALALGEYDRVIEFAAQALQISQTIANLWGQSFSQMFVGYVYLERGDFTTTIETMKACIRLGDDAGFILAQIVTRAELGWVYGTLGAVDRGLELARAARAMAEQRVPHFRTWILACLARLHVLAGQLGEAETVVGEGYAAFTEDFAQHAWIELPLAEAELALAKGEPARAIGVLDGLLGRFRQFRIRTFLSEALYLKGRALLGLDRLTDASEVLQAALAEAESLGARRIQWQVLAALSEIEQQGGHAPEAETLRARAKENVDYLAAHTPDDLRGQFMNLPNVRAVRGTSPSPSGRGPG